MTLYLIFKIIFLMVILMVSKDNRNNKKEPEFRNNQNLVIKKQELLNFSKKPDFPKFEKEILSFWKENKVFNILQQKQESRKEQVNYKFFDGPITSNNPMGVHHAYGRSLKDLYQRYNAMKGKKLRYQNGFDCQGLWVEVEVEKALGLNSKKEILDFGLKEFSKACKKRVLDFAEVITNQSIRLGQWMEWDNSYFTYSDNNILHIWYFLKKVYENGWLYRGHRVMPWCPRCGTSLSAHELGDSYVNLVHKSVFLRLPVKGEPNTYFMVWTTTPWTLSSNVALAINPELDYLLVKESENQYYLASGTENLLTGEWQILKKLKGIEFLGKKFTGPFEELYAQSVVKDEDRRVIAWDEVFSEEGTGIVHIAPGCGAEDFDLGKKEKLPIVAPINEEGRFLENFDYLTGKTTKEVNDTIFSKLKERGFLYKLEDYDHRFPICWRCDQELVYKLENEWFIKSDEIRPKMLKAAKNVKWVPEHTGKAMENWLTNMQDWCISRKRYWGLPLPFYLCECGHLEVVGSLGELKQLAENPSLVDTLPELHKPWIDNIKIKCPKCGNKSVSRIPEVGDCWLDAGIVPFSTIDYLKNKKNWQDWFPAETVIEMKEQVRLWFYSMLFMAVTLEGKSPYNSVIAFDEVRDEKGNRLSKSGKNNIVFDEVVEVMGADIMRWFYAGSNLKNKLNFSENLGIETKRKLLGYWNVVYFLLTSAKADKFSMKDLDLFTKLNKNHVMDNWLLAELQQTLQEVTQSYDELNVRRVTIIVENFLDQLSNWYVRLNRRRFWKNNLDRDKEEAYGTLYEAVITITKCLAPILPFMTEKIYQQLVSESFENKQETSKQIIYSKEVSVHLCSFPHVKENYCNDNLLKEFETVKQVITQTLMLRSKANLRVRLPLGSLYVWTKDQKASNVVMKFEEQLKNELNVKEIKLLHELTDNSRFILKPNFKKLGPQYRKNMKILNLLLADITNDQELMKDLFKRKRILTLNDKLSGEYVLDPNDYTIVVTEKEGFMSTSSEFGLKVTLNLNLTPELKAEGYVRDLIRYIQNARKEMDLDISQNIDLSLELTSDDKEFLELIVKFTDLLKRETLTRNLAFNNSCLKNPDKEFVLDRTNLKTIVKFVRAK